MHIKLKVELKVKKMIMRPLKFHWNISLIKILKLVRLKIEF